MRNVALAICFLAVLAACGGPAGSAPEAALPSGPVDVDACLSKCDNDFSGDEQGRVYARGTCKDLCYSAKAKETKNPDDCAPIRDLPELLGGGALNHQLCLTDVGAVTRSVSPCEKAGSQLDKNTCRMKVAEKLRDPSFCDAITDEMNERNEQFMRENCRKEASR